MSIERIVPGKSSWEQYYGNHIVRYKLAVKILVENSCKIVLDSACGVGYGSSCIADSRVEKVFAVDISREALNCGQKHFLNKKIKFIEDNCELLEKFTDNQFFDAVVSFETIEHLKNPNRFLKRCFSLLKSDGLLITSTPNINVTGRFSKEDWDFHEREYTALEFYNLLTENGYKNIKLYGQELTEIGTLRNQVRAEIKRINFNPFMRLGYWFQKKFRKKTFLSVLPEQEEDFIFIKYDTPEMIDEKKEKGPFVIVAIAEK